MHKAVWLKQGFLRKFNCHCCLMYFKLVFGDPDLYLEYTFKIMIEIYEPVFNICYLQSVWFLDLGMFSVKGDLQLLRQVGNTKLKRVQDGFETHVTILGLFWEKMCCTCFLFILLFQYSSDKTTSLCNSSQDVEDLWECCKTFWSLPLMFFVNLSSIFPLFA